MIKRWFTNSKWLLNHPPTDTTRKTGDEPCDYCGSADYWRLTMTSNGIRFIVCASCIKEALDKTLLNKEK